MNLDSKKSKRSSIQKENFLLRALSVFRKKGKTELTIYNELDDSQGLIESIKIARNEWINANINFEYVAESEIVDYYTYKIKACQVRYEYLLKKAKQCGIRAEIMEKEGVISSGYNLDI